MEHVGTSISDNKETKEVRKEKGGVANTVKQRGTELGKLVLLIPGLLTHTRRPLIIMQTKGNERLSQVFQVHHPTTEQPINRNTTQVFLVSFFSDPFLLPTYLKVRSKEIAHIGKFWESIENEKTAMAIQRLELFPAAVLLGYKDENSRPIDFMLKQFYNVSIDCPEDCSPFVTLRRRDCSLDYILTSMGQVDNYGCVFYKEQFCMHVSGVSSCMMVVYVKPKLAVTAMGHVVRATLTFLAIQSKSVEVFKPSGNHYFSILSSSEAGFWGERIAIYLLGSANTNLDVQIFLKLPYRTGPLLEGAQKILGTIVDCCEEANLLGVSEEGKKRILHFASVGCGPTRGEFVASFHDSVNEDLVKIYPRVKDSVEITVLEVGGQILSTFYKRITAFVEDKFQRNTQHGGTQIQQGEYPHNEEVVSSLVLQQWDPGGIEISKWKHENFLVVAMKIQFDVRSFKVWDPGGLCWLFNNHLEDKVNFLGGSIDENTISQGQERNILVAIGERKRGRGGYFVTDRRETRGIKGSEVLRVR